ncbi:hypothetical protein W02_03550 [Nitrospira sp. KM1]|uniref:hypothetical protein n=1 Tax=Nitrospira sp. KM1 TaxID=1936990 RepID=UPI0013A78DF9|nr:hypothetical protein [Nitrospira sp. KM1]BCA53215.1 hypothetical protein W02_03550 [Nitrospira sp. KM1]
MTTIFVRQSARILILLGIGIVSATSAHAVPIKNPDNCQGPVTIGVATCPDKPGHWVECLPGGEYMCCVGNSQGGKDCEQIEDTTSGGKAGGKMGGLKAPLGNLQMSPATTPPPTTRVPKSGVPTAPIMRRGVEGEQTDTTMPNPPSSSSENK